MNNFFGISKWWRLIRMRFWLYDGWARYFLWNCLKSIVTWAMSMKWITFSVSKRGCLIHMAFYRFYTAVLLYSTSNYHGLEHRRRRLPFYSMLWIACEPILLTLYCIPVYSRAPVEHGVLENGHKIWNLKIRWDTADIWIWLQTETSDSSIKFWHLLD